MMKLSWFCMAGLGAAAITSPMIAAATPRVLTPVERAMIKHTMGQELSDPDNAEYVLGPDATESDTYCGIVNAKNRMGGYTGYVPFKIFVNRDGRGFIIKTFGGLLLGDSDDKLLVMIRPLILDNCRAHGFKVDY